MKTNLETAMKDIRINIKLKFLYEIKRKMSLLFRQIRACKSSVMLTTNGHQQKREWVLRSGNLLEIYFDLSWHCSLILVVKKKLCLPNLLTQQWQRFLKSFRIPNYLSLLKEDCLWLFWCLFNGYVLLCYLEYYFKLWTWKQAVAQRYKSVDP